MSSEVRLIRGRARAPRSDEPLHRGVYILPEPLHDVRARSPASTRSSRRIDGSYQMAAICILVAHVFDGLDGRIARLTQVDQLVRHRVRLARRPGRLRRRARHPRLQLGARAVGTLGLARGLALRRLRRAPPGALQRAGRPRSRRRHFIGLPIPAAADTVASTVLLYYFFGGEGATHKHIILLVVIYALAALMVSNVRYYSFKELPPASRGSRSGSWSALIVGTRSS